jgi:CRP-like cAMP-binding protein
MIQLSPTTDTRTAYYDHEETSFDKLVKTVSVGFNSLLYPAGVELFHQGTLPTEIFLVETGLVKLVSSEESGRELIVDIRFAGSLLGLSAVIRNQPHSLTAATVSACRLVRISGNRFKDTLNHDAQLAESVHDILSSEVITQSARIAEIACLTARQRLENFIWRMTQQTRSSDQNNSKLQLPLRQWEVAQFLAITPAYLCRLLADLQAEGIIVRRNGWIIVSPSSSLWHRAD